MFPRLLFLRFFSEYSPISTVNSPLQSTPKSDGTKFHSSELMTTEGTFHPSERRPQPPLKIESHFTSVSEKLFPDETGEVFRPSKLEIKDSQLNNGMRVVTVGKPSALDRISISFGVGSRTIPDEKYRGAHMVFSTWLQMINNSPQILSLSAGAHHAAKRETQMIGIDSFSGSHNQFVQFSTEILNPPQENLFRQIVSQHSQMNFINDPASHLLDLTHFSLHAPRFGTVALPLLDPKILNLKYQDYLEWHHNFIQPARMVISSTGIEHQTLFDTVNEVYSNIESTNLESTLRPSRYDPRSYFIKASPEYLSLQPFSHFNLAFHVPPPTFSNSFNPFTYSFLAKYLGGGFSFSPGGYGKGVYSKLTQTMSRYPIFEQCQAFYHSYSDSAVFLLQNQVAHENIDSVLPIFDKILSQLSVFGTDANDTIVLERFKNQLLSQVVMSTDDPSETLANQLLASSGILKRRWEPGFERDPNSYTTLDEISAKIKALTCEDVSKASELMFQKPCSITTFGTVTEYLKTNVENSQIISSEDALNLYQFT